MQLSFKDYYSTVVEKVNKQLDVIIDDIISDLEIPFLEYYVHQIKEFIFAGGKRIRPVLMVTSYGAVNSSIENEAIYNSCVSIEILHNASLIHDDIMDHSETRRGQKAFHILLQDYASCNYPKKNIDPEDYALAMGILGGDFAYSLAYRVVQESHFEPQIVIDTAKEFNHAFIDMVKGVIFETDMQGRFEVEEKHYFKMIEGKTGALFKRAARMGAIYGKGTEKQINALGDFALNAGIAFQIVDDVIGTFGDPQKTGKPVDSDIKEGKKTLLLINTIENANEDDKKILQQTVGNKNASVEAIEHVRSIIKECGALDYANEKTKELYERSKIALENIKDELDQKYYDYLIEIAKMGVFRKK